MKRKEKTRIIFLVLFAFWFVLFLYLDAQRFLRKVEKTKVKESGGITEDRQVMSIQELADKANNEIKKDSKVIFVSPDGLAFMHFNLLTYPIVAKRTKLLSEDDMLTNDYFVFFDVDGPIKFGVIKKDDLY